ncbi:MAG: GrpB family protein [Chloroflexota bacterium]
MIGLEAGVVKLVPYDVGWQRLFMEEKVLLETAVNQHILTIQHVGSTAIPGMVAKPIIDIGIAVDNYEAAAACIAPIEQLGYRYRGENGIPRRHYFCKGKPRTHHIHINEIGSEAWANHILFRDYLIQYPEKAAEYASLKVDLAQKYRTERQRYSLGKDAFVAEVLRLAQGVMSNPNEEAEAIDASAS